MLLFNSLPDLEIYCTADSMRLVIILLTSILTCLTVPGRYVGLHLQYLSSRFYNGGTTVNTNVFSRSAEVIKYEIVHTTFVTFSLTNFIFDSLLYLILIATVFLHFSF